MSKSFFTGTEFALYVGSENFATKIAADPGSLGLTEELVEEYGVLNAAWRSAYEVSRDPQQRTKGTIAAKTDRKIAVRMMASRLARIISGSASVSDQQKIDLGLSVRAAPAPMPAPGTPTRFGITLSPLGSLELSWKCANPRGSTGTMYEVWRRIGGGELTYLGGSGKKRFTDNTLPAGSSNVMYQVQAVRSTKRGECAQYNVNFGVGVAGSAVESSLKLRAAA